MSLNPTYVMVTDAYSDYAYANYMYQYDATYREMVEEERHQREEQKAAVERYEAELDARNPLMTRFTKQVIDALNRRKWEVEATLHGKTGREYWSTWCLFHEIDDLERKYQARLEHYQGLR